MHHQANLEKGCGHKELFNCVTSHFHIQLGTLVIGQKKCFLVCHTEC